MIDSKTIKTMFGVRRDLPEELLQTIFEFTMGFYYAEARLFDCNASIGSTNIYAEKLLRVQNHEDSFTLFDYFRERYVDNKEAGNRIIGLVPGDNGVHNPQALRNRITKALSVDRDSTQDIISANLMVIIRLRHNLFHANKYSSLEDDPKGQQELINRCVSYLSFLLKSIPE